jgi:LAS superfamily LD-carboxypeptidase LdcB
MRVPLDPDFAAAIDELITAALREGIVDAIHIDSGYRSSQEQRRLFAAWKSGKSSLPAAAPGTSYHEVGLAIDVVVSPPGALEDFGLFAESLGFRWGGRFNDPVHIDAGNDVTIQEARRAFKVGDLVNYEV